VHAGASERVEIERHRRDERLPLTRLHLGDVPLVQDDRTHELHVEGAHVDGPSCRLAHGSERLEGELVEGLAVLEPLLELGRLGGELGIGEPLEVGLERCDVVRLLSEFLEPAALAHAKDALEGAVVLRH
jgi:hypothetical protein